MLHLAKKGGDDFGDSADRCNKILNDPANMEQHVEAAQDARSRLRDDLRELGVEAGVHAATGPFVEAAEVPHP